MRECHRQSGLSNRHLFLTLLEAGKSKIEVLADLVSGKDLFLDCRWLPLCLKRSRVFPILLFVSLHDHWGRLSYLSLLFFGTLHSNGHIFLFFPLFFASLLFTAICKASSDTHFAFLHLFFLGIVLITASCTMSQTSIHSSSMHSIRSSLLNLFLTSTV